MATGSNNRDTTANSILTQIREEMLHAYRAESRRVRQVEPETAGLPGNPQLPNTRDMRSLLSTARSVSALVGKMPLGPETLRARIGASIIRVVQRMLFWYTPQIVSFQSAAVRTMEAQASHIESISAFCEKLLEHQDEFEKRTLARIGELEAALGDSHRQIGTLQANILSVIDQSQVLKQSAQMRLREIETAYANCMQALQRMEEEIGRGRAEQEIRASAQAVLQELDARRTEFIERQREAESTLSEFLNRQRVATAAASRLQRTVSEPPDDKRDGLDSLYVALEDEFRGSREEIKRRQAIYLPYLRNSGIGTADMPLLDIGCGRGEWLEINRDHGFHASGVDINFAFASQCGQLGLNAVEADAGSYLRQLPDASLGAVTAFHVIEHLPFEDLLNLFDEALRVLKPGGMVIFETPNPSNFLVSSLTFHIDPTHRKPIPSPLARFLAKARGFGKVEILELHAFGEKDRFEVDGEVAARLNTWFYGPMDYAVIAWKV